MSNRQRSALRASRSQRVTPSCLPARQVFGELAGDGDFEDRLAVLFEQLFGFFEGGYAGVDMGEEFFYFGDDAFLLFKWS